MLSRYRHSELVAMAGPIFDWPCGGTSRLKSVERSGLYRYLREYAGTLCAFCGIATQIGEMGHVVSSGKGNGNNAKGYTPGNLGWCCIPCNAIDGARWAVIPYETIVRVDLIPDYWPDNQTLALLGELERAQHDTDRLHRCTLRGITPK